MDAAFRGSITLIVGGMFASKSDKLISHLKRSGIAKLSCIAFRPARDTRQDNVCSRTGSEFEAISVAHASEIPALAAQAQVVGIDEAQFFGDDLRDAIFLMAQRGQRVFVAALNADFGAKPFDSISPLYAIATQIEHVHAVCVDCGEEANFSQRLVASAEQVVVGDREYKACCLRCYEPPSS
jgi:thymidine kinase